MTPASVEPGESTHFPPAPERRGWTGGATALDWIVRLCVLGAGLAVVGGMLGGMLVQAGHVVPGWAVGGILLVAAAIVATIRALRRRRAPGHARRASGRWRPWRVAATAVITLAAAAGLVNDLSATYTVLTPAGPGGCQLAVREHSFLFAGGGEVYSWVPQEWASLPARGRRTTASSRSPRGRTPWSGMGPARCSPCRVDRATRSGPPSTRCRARRRAAPQGHGETPASGRE